jgi:uncharacterized protein YbjT (DUF2867 family)
MSAKPILIIGSTGKTGRRVAERLTARSVPFRHGSRSGTPPFDWDNNGSLWTFAEAIAEIARATGRDIRFRAVTPDAYRAALVHAPLPAEIINLVQFTTVLDGRNTPISDGVQRALGRPPGDFSDYVKRTAPTGVWGG